MPLRRWFAENFVPQSDGAKRLRHGCADHFIGLALQRPAGIFRTHWRRHHQPGRMLLANNEQRRTHGRAGRQAVIDDDLGATNQAERWPLATVELLAPHQLSLLVGDDFGDRFGRNAEAWHRTDNAKAAAGNCIHGIFLMAGKAEFAHDETSSGACSAFATSKPTGAPPGEGKHQQIGVAGAVHQLFIQHASGMPAVEIGQSDVDQGSVPG